MDNNYKNFRIVFIVEQLNGRGGMENVTGQVISELNKSKDIKAGLFILNSGEYQQSSEWMDGTILGESKCSLRNAKIKRFIHTLHFSKFIKNFKPTHIISLNTIPTLISRRAISFTRHSCILSTWIHLPPKERYRPHYLTLADHHFAISSEIKNQLINLGADEKKIDVIYNPVHESNATISRPVELKLLYVGRVHFEDQKQLKDLFDALKSVKRSWSLDIIGDGTDRGICEEYIKSIGISEKITWHGWKSNPWDYIESELYGVSCLVLTSNHEGLPLVLLEAMARGIYCISSDCVSGPSEIIKEGINGELYPKNDVLKLTSILNHIAHEKLPSQEIIKSSIANFYVNEYMKNFIKVLNEDVGNIK